MNGGVEKYQDGQEWAVVELMANRFREKNAEYLVHWQGYNHSYDTWEPAASIAPALIKAYHAVCRVLVPLEHPFHDLREAVAQRMLKLRKPEASVEVSVPIAALGPVAHALLARAARLPATRGGKAARIERVQWKGTTTSSVQLEEPADVGAFLQLQLRREGAFGCAFINKGRGGNSNMTIMGAPFVLSYTEPNPRPDGLFVPGAKFTVTGHVWVFHGRTGAMLPLPGMPNETMHRPLGEYLKEVLRGRKAWGLKHRLQDTWAELPSGRMELSIEQAMPKLRVKRARAGPQLGGEAAPAMRSLE